MNGNHRIWRRWLVVPVCLGIVSLALVAWLSARKPTQTAEVKSSAATQPADKGIGFEHSEVNLGQLPVGVRRTTDVWVRNYTSESLRIEAITTTCKCNGEAVFSSEPIAPGERRMVNVGINPRTGHQAEPVALRSSNGAVNFLRLVFEGYYDVFLDKAVLDVGQVSSATGAEASLYVMGDTEKFSPGDIQIKSSLPVWMSVAVEAPTELQRKQQDQASPRDARVSGKASYGIIARIRVTLKEAMPRGAFNVLVSMESTQADGARPLAFQCLGQAMDEVYATPSPVMMLRDKDGGYSGTMQLQSLSRAFRIVSATADPANCSVEHPDDVVNKAEIRLRRSAGASDGNGTVTFRLEHPSMSSVQVPVKWVDLP